KLGSVHWPTFWLSAFALALLLAFRRIAPKLPGAAVAVAAGIVLSALLGFEARGIQLLGHIDRGLPAIGVRELPIGAVPQLIPGALSLALLIYASSVLTSRVFADKNRYTFKPDSELFGIAA